MPGTVAILQQPYQFAVVRQKLIVLSEFTDVLSDGFKYKITLDMVIDGVPEFTLVFYVSPNPSDKLIFDLSPIIREYVFTKIQYSSTSIHKFNDEATIFINEREVVVGASIIPAWMVDGVLTDNPQGGDPTTLTPIYLVNGTYQIQDGYRQNPNERFGMTTTSSRFISDRLYTTHRFTREAGIPFDSTAIIIPVRESDWGVLTMVDKSEDIGVDDIEGRYITIYSDGVPVTELFNVPSARPTLHAGVYPANLNASSFVADVRPSAFPTWKYYTVKATEDKSATYYFINMDYYNMLDCKNDVVRVAWVGQSGGWEYFNFIKKNEESISVERKRFQKVVGDYSGDTFSFNSFDAGLTELTPIAEQFINITSDWIQEGEFIYLKGLIISKQVHWVQDNGSFIPVVVEANDYKMARERNGKLKNLELKLRLANNLVT